MKLLPRRPLMWMALRNRTSPPSRNLPSHTKSTCRRWSTHSIWIETAKSAKLNSTRSSSKRRSGEKMFIERSRSSISILSLFFKMVSRYLIQAKMASVTWHREVRSNESYVSTSASFALRQNITERETEQECISFLVALLSLQKVLVLISYLHGSTCP